MSGVEEVTVNGKKGLAVLDTPGDYIKVLFADGTEMIFNKGEVKKQPSKDGNGKARPKP